MTSTAFEIYQEVQAVAVRQDEVDDGEGELARLHTEHGADGVGRGLDVVALTLERQAEVLRDDGLVVDDQDAGFHGIEPSTR